MTEESEKLELSDEDTIDDPMRRLYNEYVKNERLPIFAGLFGSLISRILDLLPPLLLAVALDTIILDERPFNLPLVPNSYLPTGETGQLYLMLSLIGGSFLLAAGFHWGRNWGWNALAQRVQHKIRTDAYDAMQDLGMPFFANHQTGEMMSVLSNDANQLERFLNDGLNSFFRLLVMVLGIAGILVYLNWQLALVALLSVPVLLVFTIFFIRTIQPKYEDVRSSVGSLNSRLENNIGGMRIIKVSTTEDYESERVEEESDSYLESQWDAIKTRIKFFPALRLVSGFGFTLTFAIGGLWVLSGEGPLFFTGELSPGDFVVFVLYTQRFVWPVAQFGQIINKYQRARASAKRLLSLIYEDPYVDVPENPANLDNLSGHVVYDSVSFGYREDEKVIDDVSFVAEEGETVALAGPTGAGKSTILKLLLRMYDVDDGSIEIDGINLNQMNPKELRENIGYVSQNPFLFEGTIAENIDYGVFESDREDIVEAAKMAEAHGFIEELKDGYDTYVGERGVKLSGGQRQRIAIARAILQDPEIMILDEATSDVDTETELLIQQGLEKVTEDRTTFAIAHRLSTIKDADKILVIENGQIVEQGEHDELVGNDELYKNLWMVQTGNIDQVSDEFIEKVTDRRDSVDEL
jgi:ATP-binding cassette subfamily B protein